MAQEKDPVATGIGWFSIALGTAQLAAPRKLARAIGLRDSGMHARAMRLRGITEIASGAGILARRRPAKWLYARSGGDVLDLLMLAKAESRSRARTAGAMGAVAGVLLPDLLEGARLSRGNPSGRKDVTVRKATTIRRPQEEVYDFWRDLENLPGFMVHLESVQAIDDTRSRWRAKGPGGRAVEWEAEIVEERPAELLAWRSLPGAQVEHSGSVRFSPAPGNRGTELIVELAYAPPGGELGALGAKLFGEEPATQLADDLRRLKQVIEAGEIARSDGSLEGHSLGAHLKQRPAQPTKEEVSVQ
jgi:uncharacterized membrane protein